MPENREHISVEPEIPEVEANSFLGGIEKDNEDIEILSHERANESLPKDVVSGARRQIDMVYYNKDEKYWHRMMKDDPDFYKIIHEPGAYEQLRPIQGQLESGKTFNDLFRWAGDSVVDGSDRWNRVTGLRAFSFGLFKHVNPDHKKEAELTADALSYSRLADEAFLESNRILESGRWERIAKPQKDVNTSRALDKKEVPLAKHIPTQEQTKKLSYQPEVFQKDEKIYNPRKPESSERGLGRNERWKLGFEKLNGDADHDKPIADRREALRKIFDPKSGYDDLQKETWARARQTLEKLEASPDTSSLMRRKMDPQTFARAQELLQQMEQGEKSFIDVVQATESVSDAKALRLIGMSFLEIGYGQAGTKNFVELPEMNKGMVRVGEIIGLEAERKIIERMASAGKLTPDKAAAAQKRYFQLANSDDIPRAFQKRFLNVEQKLREKFNLGELHLKETQPLPEAAVSEGVSQSESETVASETVTVEHLEASDEQIREAVAPFVNEQWIPNQQGRQEVQNFLNDVGEHMEYAMYITDTKSLPGKLTALVEKIVHRPALHRKIFGWTGMVRSIFMRKEANRQMAQVRGWVFNVLKGAEASSGNPLWGKYAELLAEANRREPQKTTLDPETEQIIDKGQELEAEVMEGAYEASASTPFNNSTNEDEIIDLVQIGEKKYAPAGYVEKTSERKEASSNNNESRTFLEDLVVWRRSNPSVESLDAWRLLASDEAESSFRQALVYARERLGSENMDEEELWRLIGQQAGVIRRSKPKPAKKAA
ncbi:MAG: hypothetical protein HYR90_00095 [Candidatus Andersenbacteria bacterium]|nr:hypothetical protein [Candidatus Andersenbacteria bacterium]MBI3251129.1 hypothetical protein [Candidatus Andersenbacteria bacterium]